MKIDVHVTGIEPLVDAMQALTAALSKTSPSSEGNSTVKTATTAKTSEKSQEETKPVTTLEEVRAKLAALSQDGKQAEVKALIKKYGGAKLSDITKDKYPSLLKDAEEL